MTRWRGTVMMLPGLCSARSKTLFWTGLTLAIVAIL